MTDFNGIQHTPPLKYLNDMVKKNRKMVKIFNTLVYDRLG